MGAQKYEEQLPEVPKIPEIISDEAATAVEEQEWRKDNVPSVEDDGA